MDSDFIVALLSASRLLVRRRYDFDACSLQIPFTAKTLDATEPSNVCARICVCRKYLEVAGSAGDTSIHEGLGDGSRDDKPVRVLTLRPSF
jgi:hypothetical protein